MGSLPLNTVLHGDCVEVMRGLPSQSVDFVLTDPPYLVRYRSRDGQTIINDDRDDWLEPAFAGMYRLLKPNTFCVSFYGWNTVDKFMAAWRAAGFRIVGHIVFTKRYASSSRFLAYHHEQAYLLVKGSPAMPIAPLADVIPWSYTGNRFHPTQKPVSVLSPLINAFCRSTGVVLDPFCGSGSTLVATYFERRPWIGIELAADHHSTAVTRMRNLPLRNELGASFSDSSAKAVVAA